MALVIVMVGMPARGKTYMARKLARYLRWLGHETRVFNVGNYRRERLGAHLEHAFFDPANAGGRQARFDMARAAMDDLLSWTGEVAIYDATNSTRERRDWVRARCAGHELVFVESICNDPAIVEQNIRETKVSSPDYAGVDPEEAVADFRARIAHYERAYEPLAEDEGPWVKVIDVGRKVEINQISGYLVGRLVFLLMNLHVVPRPIWLTRHGESEDNAAGRIGGDSELTPAGRRYARALAKFVPAGTEVWTSTLRRTAQTAESFGRIRVWPELDEIDAGVCDGMTYADIERAMPDEYAARKADKLRYRYPRGESYQDVIRRLDPVIIELERVRHPVLVIAHNAVCRALYAYLQDRDREVCPHLDMPLHTVIEIVPRAYGADERRIALG